MFAYLPAAPDGPGFAIITDRFLGLLSSDAKPVVVAELYRLLDAPAARIEDVLDIFSVEGSAQRFALVEVIDPAERAFQIAVRGDVAVDLRGATVSRFTGPAGTSWIVGEARGVEFLRLSLQPSPPDALRLPLARGAVYASEVGVDELAHGEPELHAPVEPTLATVPITLPAPPSLVAETAEPVAAVAPPAAPDRRPVPVDLARLARPASWTLRLPDGNELDAAAQIVVGRRPWRSSPDETSTYYVVAPSPRREISGVHLELAVVGGELQARDLDSTNGTLVLAADRPPRLLHGGRAMRLRTGDTLDLGEGFRIVVGSRD